MRNAKTYMVVTLVTLLIWVWAETETQRGVNKARAGAEIVEITVAELPVFIAMPAGRGERVTADERVIKELRLRGRKDILDQVREGSIKPKAVVVLGASELAGDVATRQIEIGGLNTGAAEDAVRIIGPTPTVTVRIARN